MSQAQANLLQQARSIATHSHSGQYTDLQYMEPTDLDVLASVRSSWLSLCKYAAVQEFEGSRVGTIRITEAYWKLWAASGMTHVATTVLRGSACSSIDELICDDRSAASTAQSNTKHHLLL